MHSNSSAQPINAPYALLARYYDSLVSEAAPMNRHARGRILRTVLPRVRRVCDLACGSGETAIDLARSGLEVHAVDLSPVFCRAVRAKARRAGLRIAVHCADMRDFVLPRGVDLVLAEFAALNNLADRHDLRRVFEAVAGALAAGGWFLFDVNTPLALRTQYAQTYWVEGRRARLDLEWFVPVGRLWRHVRETVWNVCWTDAEIRRALREAGFSRVRKFDGVDVRPRVPGARRGTDAYYLAHRGVPPGG
jgi:SAM-dependent methyltransferase